MQNETTARLMARLEHYTSERVRRSGGQQAEFANFIIAAREKNMPWKEISTWIQEEAGCVVNPGALRVWWWRRKKA